MTAWEKILSSAEVPNAMRERKKTYIEKTAWRSALEDEEQEGWYFFKDTKDPKKVKMHKDKTSDEVFENRMWVLFASMGFYRLNSDRHFEITYSEKGDSHKKQIDVFAADDETVLVVECKCSDKMNNNKPWKTEIEAIHGYMPGVKKEISKAFPDHNIKFIFACHNYVVGETDQDLMNEFGIAFFDDKAIKYYEELVKHLGGCARYQLLGSLFANTIIKGMDNRVAAIQGKMGGYTYYTFCIQPEVLLKIGYVLHRSEANEGMMPTYQRIIKKARLKAVHDFIENHGFFPNSLLISIDTKGKRPLQFDYSEKQANDDVTKLGILHLPNVYRSAFIIDGQHRLYGYSDSKYAKINSIPVVAFENMDQKDQVKLFMEINENQKAVSKNLRNTLNADLLWISDNPIERREAIRSRIAQDLGDNANSPLYGRVIIGEDQKDDFRCITLEMICSAIKDTAFLTKFNKDKTPTEHGIFDLDINEKTVALIEKYLFGCFAYMRELLPDEWDKNPKQDGIILFNNAVGGFIRLFNDVALQLIANNNDPKNMDDFLEETHYYLDPLEQFFSTMTNEAKQELRSSYGGNGPKDYWRHLERAIHKVREDFLPEGYEKYWEDHDKSHNEDSVRIMTEAEKSARDCIIALLKKNSSNWIQNVPKNVYTAATQLKSKAEYDNPDDNREIWEFFTMQNLRDVVLYGNNWSTIFESIFTLPSEEKKAGGKKAKTEWMATIDKLQKNAGRATFNVNKQQRDMLLEVEGLLPFKEK